MNQPEKAVSFKVAIYVHPDSEGSCILKNFFNITSENNESLTCNYVLHEIKRKETTLQLKMYFISDFEKFEILHPLYFKNVKVVFMVIDADKSNLALLGNFFQVVRQYNSDSKTVILLHTRSNEVIHHDVFDFIASIKGHYFEFSKITDLNQIFLWLAEACLPLETDSHETFS